MKLESIDLKILYPVKKIMSHIEDSMLSDRLISLLYGLDNSEKSEARLARWKKNPEISTLLKEKYAGTTFCLDTLKKLPSESFGYHYAKFITDNKLSPEFLNQYRLDSEDDFSYLRDRTIQIHDILHVVLGFSADLPGELGVQNALMAQLDNPVSVINLSFGMLLCLQENPEQAQSAFECVAMGWMLGKKATFLLAQKWEEKWTQPLDLLRDELNIHL